MLIINRYCKFTCMMEYGLKTKNHIWIIVSNVLEIYKSLVLFLFIFLIKLYFVIFIFKIVLHKDNTD